MNSRTSLFDSSQSQQLTYRNNYQGDTQHNILEVEENSNYPNAVGEMKENSKEMITLTMDEGSIEKPSIESILTEEQEDQLLDENIEMERIAKMNFYAFKSPNQKGIVGMCQDIKTTKSPNKKSKI
mmetsp:Transcript_29025/g.25667  ORF Transcript_29025/g.25667 Transcript_29025/m.25667 type:complete len:126 (+) Transcript_29025:475-852(+)